MESRVEKAAERKMCGYNCAQAVACTYCDLAGIDEETARNLTQGFAVGIGGSMEATCGAVIGAVNVLGLINKNPQKTMQGSRRIIQSFKEQNGTVICKELKGINDGIVKRDASTASEMQRLYWKQNYRKCNQIIQQTGGK